MKLSRRQALGSLILGANAALIDRAAAEEATSGTPVSPNQTPAQQAAGTCTLFPQAVEGPYYFDPKMVRADITEGRGGLPIALHLKIVEAGSCAPMANVRVDVWHADAGGVYSGYAGQGDARDVSTKGQTYLRGTQMTDATGNAVFTSVYPGWYPGRTPHIHIKAFLDQGTMLTGQAYFPDAVSTRVYRDLEPYKTRPVPDTTNATDWIYQSGVTEGGSIVFVMDEAANPMVAGLVIAVDRSGEAARKATGWRGMLRNLWGGGQ